MSTERRRSYRHGNLYQALLNAGLELAQEGGPEAIVLREAARRVGVTPNACYRHFADRDALAAAVSRAAMAQLAVVIEDEQAQVTATDMGEAAVGHFRAVGTGYLRFAQDQPGLFRAAFQVPQDMSKSTSPDATAETGRTPFQLLTSSLDEMVNAGVMPAEMRPAAEFLAWSAVHGLSYLVLEGPLRATPRAHINALTEQLVDMVFRGLRGSAADAQRARGFHQPNGQ